MKILKFIKGIFADLLFPRRCPVCDRPVKPFGKIICDKCVGKVRYVTSATCCKCGKPLEDDCAEYCGDCLRKNHLYDRGIALFEYKSVSDSVFRFKYRGRQEYAEYYGERIEAVLGNEIRSMKADAIIPVPIHSSKLKIRGYNQAELIAKEVSKRVGIPVRNDIVFRYKKTKPLKDLSPFERNNSLRGAFKIDCDGVKLETIIIIDDIYTTGATIDAISRALRSIGVRKIYFVALAIGRGI